MKLMYPEVDIVPGRAGQRPQATPVREEQPLPGSSVIRLSNPTTQENAFTVRVRSEEKFWQEGWYTVVALPPGQGAENAPPPGKPDQRGPQDRWVKIYVPRGGERDVLIRFNVPARPESRAGKYRYFVEVETQVIGPTEGGGRRKDRVAQVPGVAIVRPFYKWSIDLSPEERRVGRRDRSAEFEAVVTNEGNDWLYCDMQVPRPKDMQIDSPTLRLAVPPPEPGETLPALPGSTEPRPGTQRTIPLATVTKLKVFRGEITRQPIQISAQRVDAPSVPPSALDGYAGLGSVVAVPTTEKAQVGDRALIYHPPVPAKFTDFFTRGATSIRTMAFGLIGIAAAAVVTVYLYQNAFFQGTKVEPNSLTAEVGKPLLISGQFLPGCKMYMGTKDHWVEVPYRPELFHANSRATILAVPPELNHKEVKVMAQRFVRFLPLLTSLLPHNESKSLVQVGTLIVAQGPAGVDPVDPGPFKPGDHVTITGKNLGTSGAVLINNLRVVKKDMVSWAPDKIVFAVPPEPPGATLAVKVAPGGSGTQLDASNFQTAAAAVAPLIPDTKGKKTADVKGTKTSTVKGTKTTDAKGTKTTDTKGTNVSPVNPPPIHPVNPNIRTVSNTHPVVPPNTIKIVTRPPGLGTPPYESLMRGDYRLAAGTAGDQLGSNPNDVTALATAAYAWVKLGNIPKATSYVNKALGLAPKGRALALTLTAQATLMDAQGQTAKTALIYGQASDADPSLALPIIGYADHCVTINDKNSAKTTLQRAMNQPNHPLSPSETDAIRRRIVNL